MNTSHDSLVGTRYGLLTVLAIAAPHKGCARCDVLCECGATKTVFISNMIRGRTKSCGCLVGGRTKREKNKTHGFSRTRIYRQWRNMLNRCYYKGHFKYDLYGARGITVCDRWKASFDNFLNDMGIAPDGMSLERIDNNGNYEPSNCKWATQREQCRNTRRTHFVTVGDTTCSLAEWSEVNGISYNTIISRLSKGWNEADAVTMRPSRIRRERLG